MSIISRFLKYSYIVVLLCGLFITAVLVAYVYEYKQKIQFQELHHRIEFFSGNLVHNFEEYNEFAEHIAAFFSSSDSVEQAEWDLYLKNTMKVDMLDALLYARYIAMPNRNAEGACFVQYETRLRVNPPRFKENVCAETGFYNEMITAKMQSQAVLAHSKTDQNNSDLHEIILFYPIYSKKSEFIGWIAVGIDYQAVFTIMLDKFAGHNLGLEVKEIVGNNKSQENIFSFLPVAPSGALFRPVLREEQAVKYKNLQWNLIYSEDQPVSLEIYGAAIAGLGFSILCALLLYFLTRTNERANAIADRVLAKYHLSENKFRTLMELSPSGIFRTDNTGKCVYVNPAWLKLTGLQEHEAEGDGWSKALHPDDKEYVFQKWNESVLGRVDFAADFRFLRPDGEITWVSCQARPILVDGAVTGYVGTLADTTLLRAQAQELAAAKEKSENSSKMKSDFLATMSHEIRTPMNGIIGLTDIILSTGLTPDQQSYVQTLKSSAYSLLTIINDILDYSKLEAGKLKVENILFKPADCVEKVTQLMKQSFNQKSIQIITHLQPAAYIDYLGDPLRVEQVLLNFVGNAIKFTHRGQVTISVSSVEEEKNTSRLRFEVIDTGIGIPKDVLDDLFTRFTQSDTSISRKYGGTGLGLSISKQLIEMMRGTIGVESEQEKGSKFWFEIPLTKMTEAGDQSIEKYSVAASRAADPVAVKNGMLRLLVAEDNKVNQMVISAMLKKMGHNIDLVGNGLEAIEALQRKDYDLVLMDIQMPEMDGITATEEIRKMAADFARIPIIAITANAMQGDRENYLKVGMNDYVSKPINMKSLGEAIDRVQAALGQRL